MSSFRSFLDRTADLYVDGFRNMTIGRKLWILIIIKLIVFFVILKIFFFPDVLGTNYDNDVQRADAVRESLTRQ